MTKDNVKKIVKAVTIRKVNVCDMMVGESLEEAVKDFTEECGYKLVSFEEYGDRYIEDGTEYAQVNITMR